MPGTTYTVTRPGRTPVPLTVEESGSGRPFLLLHGGAGPASVLPFAGLLARQHPARTLVPTGPGWNATPRPDDLTDVRGLAELYVALLDQLDLDDVIVVGNSIGGWVAAELAALAGPRVAGIVVLDAVGIVVPGHPVADFFSLGLAELAELSYHEPDRFRIDPARLSEAQKAVMAANRQTIAVYAGHEMVDPTLTDRLSTITVPTLVAWGESDRIVDPVYGRAFAAAVPGARFQLLTGTGHLPQLETPDLTLATVWDFAVKHPGR